MFECVGKVDGGRTCRLMSLICSAYPLGVRALQEVRSTRSSQCCERDRATPKQNFVTDSQIRFTGTLYTSYTLLTHSLARSATQSLTCTRLNLLLHVTTHPSLTEEETNTLRNEITHATRCAA